MSWMEVVIKTTTILIQRVQSPGQHMNPVPPETKEVCPSLDNDVWCGNLNLIQPTQATAVKAPIKHSAKLF
jgi:hypothetical protein